MLSWVVKVVPQPPEPKTPGEQEGKTGAAPPPASAPPPAAGPPPVNEKKVKFQDEVKSETPKPEKPKQDPQTAAENGPAPGSQAGVLTWISSALPQPAVSPKLSRANSTAKEDETAARKGMISWISQGLERVVPQPELKSKEPPAAEQPAEVRQAAPAPAAEPAVPVVEVKPDQEDNKPPSMMDWIKHGIEKVVPQPEIHVRSKTEGNEKTEAPAKAEAPPPAPPPAPKLAPEMEKSAKDAEQPNMMGWIVSGIGRMLPQPTQKPDVGSDEVQTISITQKKTDLVLEDIEQEVKETKLEVMEVREELENKEDLKSSKKETEDKDPQMDELDPLVDDIKKEAAEAAHAHMEERLQQERLEAARVAEEMARKAAEEAVRQLEVEHSAKIVIETLPESNEQCLVDVCPAEDEIKAITEGVEPEETPKPPTPPTESEAAEETSPPSTDVEPVSQQPEPLPPQAPPTKTDQTSAAAEEGGVPDICSPIKSFLLRFPHAAECLESCRKLMRDHNLTPPTLAMPAPPPELAQLTQELSQLAKQAQQCCISVYGCFRGLKSKSQNP